MGLYFETSQWSDSLWKGHVRSNNTAGRMLREGGKKQKGFAAFSNDVHSALYLRNRPQETGNAPEWVKDLLEQAEGLPEWKALKARCQSRGLASGVAAESVLQSIVDNMPNPQDPHPGGEGGFPGKDGGGGQGRGTPGGGEPGYDENWGISTDAGGTPQGEQPGDSQGTEHGPGTPDPIVPPDGRRAMRKALREAIQTVEETEQAVEAMAEMFGFETPGSGAGSGESLQDIAKARALASLLQTKPQLQKIAELAGRMQRLGSAHKRVRVDQAIGAVKGITLGGDLDRLLPQAIVGIRSANRYRRLETLQTIMNKRALQYDMKGEEPMGRGPIIMCVDESGSMNNFDRDTWSKAIALALLATATEQKRAWTYIGFQSHVTYKKEIGPGEATPAIISQVLLRKCDGGTNFRDPLHEALRTLKESPLMSKADVIFVTDGNAYITDDIIEEIKQVQVENDVHLYVIGIGAECHVFQPIANEIYKVTGDPYKNTVDIAPVIVVGR